MKTELNLQPVNLTCDLAKLDDIKPASGMHADMQLHLER